MAIGHTQYIYENKDYSMQYFSTEFPLRRGTLQKDLLGECINWVSDSPHTGFSPENLKELRGKNEFRISHESEILEFDSTSTDRYDVCSLRYTKRAESIQYVTTISFLTMLSTKEVWASIKVVCESVSIINELPPLKKPVLIIRLIDRFGGGLDGDLFLSHTPTTLNEDEDGYDLAEKIILGNIESRLPIVYVSCGYDFRHRVLTERFSRRLCGLAHVIIEPSRKFSHKIRRRCNSQNVYGGVIGVYWPGGQGVKIYRHDKEWTPNIKDFEKEIVADICNLLSKRMPLPECSWGGVKDIKNKAAIERLRKDGATERELLDLYINEVEQYKQQIETLTGERTRLEALLRNNQQKRPVQGGITISSGDEEDYYDNEILGIIIDALTDYKDRVHSNSRRQHIIESLLSANPLERNSEASIREIKEGLRGYRSMTPKIKEILERHGFDIIDDRRHFKITYQSDERYTYTLPKSGSDHRGGLNAGSDITKLIY